MVYAQPTISNSGEEYATLRQHGFDIFVMCKTRTMVTGTAMPIPAEDIFSSILMAPTRTKN